MFYILGTSCYRPIETRQVTVTNATHTLCQITAYMPTPDIEVEMYLADDSHAFDYQLTWDFYNLFKEYGLPVFPFQVSYWIVICTAGLTALRATERLGELHILLRGSLVAAQCMVRRRK